MAKKIKRKTWTKTDDAALRKHSRAKTPAIKVAKLLKRTENAARQRTHLLGVSLEHQR
jgi:hypothetical protein